MARKKETDEAVVSPEEIVAKMDAAIHGEGDTDGEFKLNVDPLEAEVINSGGPSLEVDIDYDDDMPSKRGPGRPKKEKQPAASTAVKTEAKKLDSVLHGGMSIIVYYDNAGKQELCNTYSASDVIDKYKSIDAFVRTNLVEKYGWGTYHIYKMYPDGKRVYSGSVRIRQPVVPDEKIAQTEKLMTERLLEINEENARRERDRMERKEDMYEKMMAMFAMGNNKPAEVAHAQPDHDPMRMMSQMMAMKAMRDMMKEESTPRDNGMVELMREMLREVREANKQMEERIERVSMQRQFDIPSMVPPPMAPPPPESIKLGEIAELIRSLRPDASGNEVNKVVEIVDRMQGTLASVYEKRFDAMAGAMTTLADKFERALENRNTPNSGSSNIVELREQIRAVKELSNEFGASGGDGGSEVLDFLKEMIGNLPELIGSIKSMNVGNVKQIASGESTLEEILRNIHKIPDDEVPTVISSIIANLRTDDSVGPMIEKLFAETPEDKRLNKLLGVLQLLLKKFVGEKVLTAKSASRILRIVKERGIEI